MFRSSVAYHRYTHTLGLVLFSFPKGQSLGHGSHVLTYIQRALYLYTATSKQVPRGGTLLTPSGQSAEQV